MSSPTAVQQYNWSDLRSNWADFTSNSTSNSTSTSTSQTQLNCNKYINTYCKEYNSLQYTYIHTYIPPLKGVCMYVCMYYVIIYIHRKQQTRGRHNFGCKLQLNLKNNAKSNSSSNSSWQSHLEWAQPVSLRYNWGVQQYNWGIQLRYNKYNWGIQLRYNSTTEEYNSPRAMTLFRFSTLKLELSNNHLSLEWYHYIAKFTFSNLLTVLAYWAKKTMIYLWS